MIHRHLDYEPGTPVSDLGDAAIDDLLERGDLADWEPLAATIRLDPFGELAERVLRLSAANPHYGTSALWRAWIEHRRALTSLPQLPPQGLSAIRATRGLSQAELAQRIGMSQSDLSKAERRGDWKLSTLRKILAGLGLRLTLVVADEAGHVVATIGANADSALPGGRAGPSDPS